MWLSSKGHLQLIIGSLAVPVPSIFRCWPQNLIIPYFLGGRGASDVPVIVDSSCRAGRGGPALWDDDEVDGTQRSSRASVGSIGTGWNRSHVVADDSVLNTAVPLLLSDAVPVVLSG